MGTSIAILCPGVCYSAAVSGKPHSQAGEGSELFHSRTPEKVLDAVEVAAAERAFAERSGLSREESLLVEGDFRAVTQDWVQATEVFATLWRFFPNDLEYGLRLAEVETRAGGSEAALVTVAAMRRLPAPSRDDPRIDLAEAAAASSLSDFRPPSRGRRPRRPAKPRPPRCASSRRVP